MKTMSQLGNISGVLRIGDINTLAGTVRAAYVAESVWRHHGASGGRRHAYGASAGVSEAASAAQSQAAYRGMARRHRHAWRSSKAHL